MAEFAAAGGTSVHHGARWCYAAAVVAVLSTFSLLTAGNYGYLGIFGVTLLAPSSRMFFAERHRLTPAVAFATAAD
jgi:hypothetical protein